MEALANDYTGVRNFYSLILKINYTLQSLRRTSVTSEEFKKMLKPISRQTKVALLHFISYIIIIFIPCCCSYTAN
jgi:hypothetical protein